MNKRKMTKAIIYLDFRGDIIIGLLVFIIISCLFDKNDISHLVVNNQELVKYINFRISWKLRSQYNILILTVRPKSEALQIHCPPLFL